MNFFLSHSLSNYLPFAYLTVYLFSCFFIHFFFFLPSIFRSSSALLPSYLLLSGFNVMRLELEKKFLADVLSIWITEKRFTFWHRNNATTLTIFQSQQHLLSALGRKSCQNSDTIESHFRSNFLTYSSSFFCPLSFNHGVIFVFSLSHPVSIKFFGDFFFASRPFFICELLSVT